MDIKIFLIQCNLHPQYWKCEYVRSIRKRFTIIPRWIWTWECDWTHRQGYSRLQVKSTGVFISTKEISRSREELNQIDLEGVVCTASRVLEMIFLKSHWYESKNCRGRSWDIFHVVVTFVEIMLSRTDRWSRSRSSFYSFCSYLRAIPQDGKHENIS
jgi:hypothetical protein